MGEMLLNGRLYGASGIRELTQAQYDALPASKLTDGILYCIKDTGIVEGDKYAPVIYSLEEREIGVWTDGKPLYQKTVQFTIDATTKGNYVSFNHDISNIAQIAEVNSFVTNDNGRYYNSVRFASYNSGTSSVIASYSTSLVVVTESSIGYQIGSDIPVDYNKLIVTLLYTKTTDIPGSGTWGTDGVPMVHYDGNEKVIGTWFGETLYEKSFEFTNTIVNTGVATDISSLHVKDVIKLEGVWTRYSSTNAELMYPFGHQESNSHKSYLRVDSEGGYGNNGRLLYVITSDGTNRQKIILQYTKTS